MKQIVIIILLAFGLFNSTNAQSFIDRLKSQKQGEGTVVVNQSKAIDDLVNGKPAVPETPKEPAVAKPQNDTNNPSGKKTDTATAHKKPAVEAPSNNAQDASVDTSKKVMRNGHKVTGYRIQVFSGRNSRADKVKANDIGTRLKSLFPSQPIYVHFYNPRWVCRMGNYRTYQEAQSMLNEVKSMGYGQACIIKGQITVQD